MTAIGGHRSWPLVLVSLCRRTHPALACWKVPCWGPPSSLLHGSCWFVRGEKSVSSATAKQDESAVPNLPAASNERLRGRMLYTNVCVASRTPARSSLCFQAGQCPGSPWLLRVDDAPHCPSWPKLALCAGASGFIRWMNIASVSEVNEDRRQGDRVVGSSRETARKQAYLTQRHLLCMEFL
jgi:hypothetical protein